MGTVTLIRSALRGLLAAADVELWAALRSGGNYASLGKPQIDWEDPAAREQLIHSRVLRATPGTPPPPPTSYRGVSTVAAAPAFAPPHAWTQTSACSPRRSTSPDSPPSAPEARPAAGRADDHRRPAPPSDTPLGGRTRPDLPGRSSLGFGGGQDGQQGPGEHRD
jgi:hypothetical protein